MQNINFIITKPICIKEVFDVPPDKTEWNSLKYVRNKKFYVPDRDKTFTQGKMLKPKNQFNSFFSKDSKYNYGLYLLFFRDFNKFYVGITAKYSKFVKKWGKVIPIKSPEGFLTRLRKHRAKCTATNINIAHTQAEWQPFAKNRYKKYGHGDTMSDCDLSLILFKDHKSEQDNDKVKLEYLENLINVDLQTVDPIFDDFKTFQPLAKTREVDTVKFKPEFKIEDINNLVLKASSIK